jgi:hypothetical protein
MPGFIPTPNVAKVTLEHQLMGQSCENTLWFRFRAGAFGLDDLINLGTALNTFWVANQLQLMSQDIAFFGCFLIDQTSETAPAVQAAIVPETGGIVSDTEPNNVAYCITFLTGGRGRGGRGRNYIGGVPQSQVVNRNFVQPTWSADLVAAYQAILGSPFDTDWEWVVVSHKLAGVDRTEGLPQPVIGVRSADLTLDSQRRRLPGRGT